MSEYMDVDYNDPTVDQEGNPVKQGNIPENFEITEDYQQIMEDQVLGLNPLETEMKKNQLKAVNMIDEMLIKEVGNELTKEDLSNSSVSIVKPKMLEDHIVDETRMGKTHLGMDKWEDPDYHGKQTGVHAGGYESEIRSSLEALNNPESIEAFQENFQTNRHGKNGLKVFHFSYQNLVEQEN